jgi:predicted DCC family thiol-disulfide oxidoreductase YuxK
VTSAGPLLVFDGDCGFCTASARWIAARWPAGSTARTVAGASLDPGVRDRVGLTDDDLARAAWWVDDDRAWSGHLAVGRALAAATGPWSLVGRLLLRPSVGWVAAPAYRVVVRFRHRLPGSSRACRV